MPFPPVPSNPNRRAALRGNLLRTILLLCAVFFLAPCGHEDPKGTLAPTIKPLGFVPMDRTLHRAPGTGTLEGSFWYVAPSAALSRGHLDVRACGLDPEERTEIPLRDIQPEPLGFFSVELPLPTDCDPGDYVAHFWATDERGSPSNRVEIRYTIVEPP